MNKKQEFINELFKLVSILENSWEFIFEEWWLTIKNYGVLYLISTWCDTSQKLLNGSYWSKPNMTKKLRTLEDKWYIERKIDEKDKRVFKFTLTQKADEAIKKITPLYDTASDFIFFWVKSAEFENAFKVVEKCIKNLSKINF